jgi:transposase InsO family protein
MRDLLILVIHLITTVIRLAKPGGLRAVVAESVLAKHQLLILNRSRRRARNLRIRDRLIAGFCSLWIKPSRLRKVAIALKTSTLLSFHRALVQRKYRLLFSPKQQTKPGPKGPMADLIQAVGEMKKRNPTWGCPQITDQINLAFGTSINKDVVRRILALHYRPEPGADGPSWLSFLGHTKDSLWSLDLFRCESMVLRTHWVLVVMDHYTRRIIGFGIHAGVVNGEALCRMFKQAIRGVTTFPRYLSSDHDPLYRFHQWEANLRILGVTEIKTVPYVPCSHPFVERLIGTIRRECLDRLLFWTATDLESKLLDFRDYYNGHRTHSALKGQTPIETLESKGAELKRYRWQNHCRGLYQTPIAA